MTKKTKKQAVKPTQEEVIVPQEIDAIDELPIRPLPSPNLPDPILPQGSVPIPEGPNAYELQPTLAKKPRDPRIPPVGTVILKSYHGQTIEVEVLDNGFRYQGKLYKSISRVAMDIVKRSISGYVFFGLVK